MIEWSDKFTGLLLGTAIGDALGLPREGLSPRRAHRMFGGAPLGHRLILRRGMISDDTEHAAMTAQALLAASGSPERFARSLAWRLRGWLLAMPAGVGLATLRSILRLWIGFPPARSGVYSAGNGPAMRAPILGLWMAATGMSRDCRETFLRAATRITHTDPRALEGATAIAQATARLATHPPPTDLLASLASTVQDEQLRRNLLHAQACVERRASSEEFVHGLGLRRGVTGFINHTVPFALFCTLRWPGDFRAAVEQAVLAGGDTDTTAAIVGAMAGAAGGAQALPADWLAGLCDWPRSTNWLRQLAARLARQAASPHAPAGTQPLYWPGLLLRNPLFAAIVMSHGFRRLLPPY